MMIVIRIDWRTAIYSRGMWYVHAKFFDKVRVPNAINFLMEFQSI